jgi:hypothetical protein
VHGDAGPFDINLPLTGSPGIECRSGGAGNDYQVVLTFAAVAYFTNAAVTSGTGSVSNMTGSGTTVISVNLTGITNAQTITLTLYRPIGRNQNGDDGADNVVVQMGVLLGDTTGNGNVNASDVSQTKASSGQPVNPTNFRNDVTMNGSISASDVSLVKSRSGTVLP